MRLYLDTSVLNFLYVSDAPEKRAITERLFDEIRLGVHDVYVSSLVVEELLGAQEPLRGLLTALIERYRMVVLDVTEPVYQLAGKYMEQGLVSPKYADDATHIAAATYAGIDCVVSWNFKHIVKPKARRVTDMVNQTEGHGQIDIVSPFEVISDDGED